MIDRHGRPRHPRPTLQSRAALAAAVACLFSMVGAVPAVAAVPSTTLVLVDNGFKEPLLVTNAGDGSDRLFVPGRGGPPGLSGPPGEQLSGSIAITDECG